MDKCLEILREYWGYGDFRGIQREIIDSISSGRDTLGLMPTGGGKSITFQVPALMIKGVCIVITPLIALMKDQVDHLKARGIRAAAVYSGMMHADVVATLENAIFGGVKIHIRRSENSLRVAGKTFVRTVPEETFPHESEFHNG